MTTSCEGNVSFIREIVVTKQAMGWRYFILSIFIEVLEYFVLLGSIQRLVLINLRKCIFHLIPLPFTILLSFIHCTSASTVVALRSTLPYQHFIPIVFESHCITLPQHFSTHPFQLAQSSQIYHLLTPISPPPSHQPKNHSEKLHLLISHQICLPCSHLC